MRVGTHETQLLRSGQVLVTFCIQLHQAITRWSRSWLSGEWFPHPGLHT